MSPLAIIFLLLALATLPPALIIGGINGLTLIGVLLCVAALTVQTLSDAPLQGPDVSRLDRLDGKGHDQ